LRARFNLILFIVFIPAIALSGYISWELLQRQAREEVYQSAELMTEAAQAIRNYTVQEVRPLIDQADHPEFIPQTVPAYAATQTILGFSDEFREFVYKEATLNPTNPRDRAADWESDIIQEFKRDENVTYLSGVRSTPSGDNLYVARPIKITNEACLSCHSTAAAAPAPLVAKYGSANGFGWQMNEIVGAQIISVPTTLAAEHARETFTIFMASLFGVFALVVIALNIALSRWIIDPVTEMAHKAEKVSTGDFSVAEFDSGRGDEMGALGSAFNRMRRSLEQAMKMIE
jgi:protein-histidine pros-kinase